MATRSKMSEGETRQNGMRVGWIGCGWKLTVDEGVQDGHGTVGDTSVGVDLLEDLVDVGGVGLLAGLGALLLLARGSGGLLAGLLLLSGSLAGRGLAGGGGSLLEWASVDCAMRKSRENACLHEGRCAPELPWVPFRKMWVVRRSFF